MIPMLFALHQAAAQRGDGLRTEFFKRSVGQNADLLNLLKSHRADAVASPELRNDLAALTNRDLSAPVHAE